MVDVVVKMMIRCYRQLKRIKTFEERYEYLRVSNLVGQATFGFDRYLNQMLYTSDRWKETRSKIIIRDNACDLGIDDREIYDRILVHHMNPLTIEDVEEDRDEIYDPEYLICTTKNTHDAIHFGNKSTLYQLPKERTRHDTCPWK
jgi:hypothetical protein